MKYLLIITVLFISTTVAVAQTNKDSGNVFVTHGLKIDRMKEREIKIKLFADSLNYFTKGTHLPQFLFNKCLDFNSIIPTLDFHYIVSLRWCVLEKVYNKKALKEILQLNDPRLNEKCNDASGYTNVNNMTLIDYSFNELIKKRFKELNR